MSQFDFVFYHIPKCGGTSIRNYFKNMFLELKYDNQTIYYANENTAKKNIMNEEIYHKMKPKIDNCKIILSHINCSLYPKLPAKYKITCIRNPINRTISSFNHFILEKKTDLNFIQIFKTDKPLFDTFIENILITPTWFIEKDYYDYIILFENLHSDLKEISSQFNIEPNLSIPHEIPCRQNRKLSNYFKLNITEADHKKVYQYLKTKLQPDIDIYNNICKMRNLDKFIID